MDPLTIGVLVRKRDRRTGRREPRGLEGLERVARVQAAGADSVDHADRHLPPASGRIEIADLKERVRKLEAIAAGIDI